MAAQIDRNHNKSNILRDYVIGPGESVGTLLILALFPIILEDQEANSFYQQIPEDITSEQQKEEALKAFCGLSSNVYYRIRQNLINCKILEKRRGGNVVSSIRRFTEVTLESGTYCASDGDTIIGIPHIFVGTGCAPTAAVQTRDISQVAGKFVLTAQRVLSQTEERMVPVFPEKYQCNPETIRAAKLISASSTMKHRIRNGLYFGEPGSGKTTIVKEIAAALHLPYTLVGVDGTARYKTFTMTDTIPDGLSITGIKLQQKKAAGSNAYTDIPSSAYTYRTTRNADGTQTVTLTLTNPNSSSPWLYAGETLSMAVTCQVTEKMWNYTTFGRSAAVAINGNSRGTNSVSNGISYRILTEAVNGTIDETVTRIPSGTSRTIRFAPNEGDYLKSLTVDGKEVPVTMNLDSYTFSDIRENHEIKAVFAKNPVITITKQIDRDEVVWAKGDPIFTFKIEGTDYLGNANIYYRMICFNEMDGVSKKSIQIQIPAGKWTVTELETNDWGMSSISEGTACNAVGAAGVLDTRNSDTAAVNFINHVTDYSRYTHNAYEINQLK